MLVLTIRDEDGLSRKEQELEYVRMLKQAASRIKSNIGNVGETIQYYLTDINGESNPAFDMNRVIIQRTNI